MKTILIWFLVFTIHCFFLEHGNGVANGTYVSSNNSNCVNVRCPEIPPRTCKNVVNSEARVSVVLWDGLRVLCDTQSDGGGWTIIQRRSTGDLDFYRNWEEYKYGFGTVSEDGEFWLGNENIHRISSRSPHELRIDLKFNGKDYFARYSHFLVFSEPEEYKLTLGGYSGNAGDSLYEQEQNSKFSTKDRDNDLSEPGHCAVTYHGGWWYRDCHNANLNGLWGSTTLGKGLNWYTTTDYYASANFTEIKIRPVTN